MQKGNKNKNKILFAQIINAFTKVQLQKLFCSNLQPEKIFIEKNGN